MKKLIKIWPLFLVIIAVICACNSTQLISSWKAPEASVQNYNKVLVIGLMGAKDPEMRSNVEEAVVAAFKQKGIIAQSAYEQYGPKAFDDLNQSETLGKIKRDGYDSAFTIALLDKKKEKRYNPGNYSYQPGGLYYNRFWGRFHQVYTRVYEPGYYTTSTNYLLEANFYNLNADMLQYSAQTKTFDPGSAKSLATGLTTTLIEDMLNKGIIAGQ